MAKNTRLKVLVKGTGVVIENAVIDAAGKQRKTNAAGEVTIQLDDGDQIIAEAFKQKVQAAVGVAGDPIDLEIDLGAAGIEIRREFSQVQTSRLFQGEMASFSAVFRDQAKCPKCTYSWSFTTKAGAPAAPPPPVIKMTSSGSVVEIDTTSLSGDFVAEVLITDPDSGGTTMTFAAPFLVRAGTQPILGGVLATATAAAGGLQTIASDGVTVDMERSRRKADPTIVMWQAVLETTNALSFNSYKAFMDYVLCNDDDALLKLDQAEQERITGGKTQRYNYLRENKRFLPYTDTDAYRLLKVATEAFLIVNCGIPLKGYINENLYQELLERYDAEDASGKPVKEFWKQHQLLNVDQEGYLYPYLSVIYSKLPDIPVRRKIFSEEDFNPQEAERCYGIVMEKLYYPCMIELIWNYWIEEGMTIQTINSISRRFQNVRGPMERDPLANVETDPLRPLNNLLWGYVQDEQHRLSVLRRAYEYDHHYGLSLEGDAVPALRTADSRSRFLEAFHQMLQIASFFYKQDDDTTMVADGFALLNALRDLHMILSEGAHNQYGDLPTTARIEMMMEQWLLARPEFRELLPTRTMVAYPEPWMDRVDAMKRLQGWTDTSITHFRYLAIFGEQILLSVRFTNWSEIDNAELAAVWARFFRNQVKGYIHAYRAVTGVDLSAETTTTQQRELFVTRPSVLLQQRLQSGQPAPALPAGVMAPQSFRQRRPARRPAGD